MTDNHPCNICQHNDCPYDCVWNTFYIKKYECNIYDCFMNYEGSCSGGFYDKCQLCTDLAEKAGEQNDG